MPDKYRRHEVGRYSIDEPRANVGLQDISPRSRNHVRDEREAVASIPHRGDRHFSHKRRLQDMRLHLARFDTKAAHFDLPIDAAKEAKVSGGGEACAVSAAVAPCAGRSGLRIRDKALCRPPGMAGIAERYPGPADAELALGSQCCRRASGTADPHVHARYR